MASSRRGTLAALFARRSTGVLALCASACGSAGPETAKPPQTNPTPATLTARAPVGASAPAASAPTAPALPARTRVAHDFHRIYEDWGGIVFHDGRPLLFAGSGAADLSNGRILFERLFANAAVYEGDSLWYADGFSPMSACPRPAALVQLVGEKWVPRRDLNVHDLRVSAWLPGASLAAMVPRRAGPPWGYELTVLEKSHTPPVAERAGPLRQEGCFTRIGTLSSLQAFRTGEIFVFGSECPLLPQETNADDWSEESAPEEPDEQSGWAAIVVERFAKGARRSTFTTIPLRELTGTFGVAPDDLWATGSVSDTEWRMAHYDGASWTLLPEKFGQELSSLFVLPGERGLDARRLYIAGKALLEFSHGSTVEHELPDGCAPMSFDLQGEHLWLTCQIGEYGGALFATTPNVAPFRFPDGTDRPYATWSESSYPRLDPKAPGSSCGAEHREWTPPRPSLQPGSKAGSKLSPRQNDYGY